MAIHCAIHSVSIYEQPTCQTLVDVVWCDSAWCMGSVLDEFRIYTDEAGIAGQRNTDNGSISWGPYPGGEETDYDVYCGGCDELMWEGLQVE